MKVEPQAPKVTVTSTVRFLATLSISVVTVALVSFIYIYQQFTLQQQSNQIDELLRLELASTFIARALEEIATDIRWLAESAAMSDYRNNQNSGNTARLEQEFLNLVKNTGLYDQLRIIDQTGNEKIRVNFNKGNPVIVDKTQLQDKSNRYYFKKTITMARQRIYISPLDLNIENGVIEQPLKPVIRFAIPLFDPEKPAPIGVLVLNYMAALMLKDFEHMMANGSGTAMILNQYGNWLYRQDHRDEWSFLKGNRETFGSYYPSAWYSFLSKESGIFQNSKGLFIFSTLRLFSKDVVINPIVSDTSNNWKIVTHIQPEGLGFYIWETVTHNRQTAILLFLFTTLFSYAISHLRTVNIENTKALKYNQSQYRNLFENMADGYALQEAIFDDKGRPYDFRYLEVNSAFEKILNLKRENVIGKTVLELLPTTEPYWLETFANVATTGKPARLEQFSGTFGRYFEIAATSPSHGLVAVIFSDVTLRKRNEEQLRQAAVVFSNTTEAIMVTDADGKVISINKAFTKITGFELEDVVNKNPRFQSSGKHDDKFYQNMWRTLNEHGQWQGEIWNRRKDGSLYPVWQNVSVVKDDQGWVTHYISVFSDISAIKQTESKLNHLAHHDSLTGLANRLAFTANLEQALERAHRHQQKVALLFMDLDRFKQINDTMGHAAGDRVLQVVATRLKKSVRAQDVVCRLGGDEFTIILEELTNVSDTENLAKKIIKFVSEPIMVDKQAVSISTSVGISIFPDDANNAQDLAKAGDAAMYSAKSRGRQTFAFFAAELDHAH